MVYLAWWLAKDHPWVEPMVVVIEDRVERHLPDTSDSLDERGEFICEGTVTMSYRFAVLCLVEDCHRRCFVGCLS